MSKYMHQRVSAVSGAKQTSNANALLTESTIGSWLNKIHQGDCLEIMKRMPEESVGLIVTSPQYNLRNSTGNGMKDGRGGKWSSAGLLNGYAGGERDDMPHPRYVASQRERLTAMMRLLRSDGAIFHNHKWRVQGGLLQDRTDILHGFAVRQIIIWQRGGFYFNEGYFLPTYEVIYLICKPEFKLAATANQHTDVWTILPERNNDHPATFPIALARRCIESTTAQIILDPYLGSGTTAVAAKMLGRNWVGIERSQEYCDMANRRVAATTIVWSLAGGQ